MTAPQYTTTDIYLAAFLCDRGMPLQGVKRLRPKKVEFRFDASEELHMLLRLYWSGEYVLLIPSTLFAELHRLRCLSITRP